MAIRKPGQSGGSTKYDEFAKQRASSNASRPKQKTTAEKKPSAAKSRKPGNSSSSGVRVPKRKNDTSTPKGRKQKSNLKKRNKTPIVLIVIFGMLLIVFMTSYISYNRLVNRYENPIVASSIELKGEKVSFKITRGMSTKELAAALQKAELISNGSIFRFLSKFNGYDGMYNAGTYTLCKGLTMEEVMVILSGSPNTVSVTFPEGFSTKQIAERLVANKVLNTTQEFYDAIQTIDVSKYKFIGDLSQHDHRLDGYLFPDTYKFDVDSDAETVIYKMLNRFNELFTPAYYTRAETLGMTIDQIVTMASLIEKESQLASERTMISSVFYNRLKNKKSFPKLESCATIQYVYEKINGKAIEGGNVTTEHTKLDDPYNTYMHEGLPPGPIANPGIASIRAALYPVDSKYYFFVAKGDGTGEHGFSETLKEHNRKKAEYGSTQP